MNSRKPPIEVMDDAMADILRQKTEVERLQIAARMWRSARVILRGAIRTEHPDWDAERVNREIAKQISHGEGDVDHERVKRMVMAEVMAEAELARQRADGMN